MPRVKKAKNIYDFDEETEDPNSSILSSGKSVDEDSQSDEEPLAKVKTASGSNPRARTTRSSARKTLAIPHGRSEMLYCICQKPFDNRFMIECDKCHEWFHGDCIGITLRQGKQMEKRNEEYECNSCRNGKSQHNQLFSDDDDESVSLAAIRQQSLEKLSDDSASTSNDNVIAVKEDAEAPIDNLKREVAQMKDFSSLLKTNQIFTRAEDKADTQTLFKIEKQELPSNKSSNKALKREEPAAPLAAPFPIKRFKDNSSDRCFVGDCDKKAALNSIYCSQECIRSHCDQSIKSLRINLARFQGKPENSSELLRLSVIDAKSGRLINDHKLVNEKTIEKFITKHQTFRIVTPQRPPRLQTSPHHGQQIPNNNVSTNTTGVINAYRITVRQDLRDALKSRVDSTEDFIISVAEISRVALRIEESMFNLLGGTSCEKYKQRFRCLLLNLKDARNKSLFRRILLGEMPPDEIATCPSERFASDELIQWREQQRKKTIDMIIATETDTSVPESEVKSKPLVFNPAPTSAIGATSRPSLTHLDLSTLDDSFKVDTTPNHRSHLFDVNCKICTGKGDNVVPKPAFSTSKLPSAYSALASESIDAPEPSSNAPNPKFPFTSNSSSAYLAPTQSEAFDPKHTVNSTTPIALKSAMPSSWSSPGVSATSYPPDSKTRAPNDMELTCSPPRPQLDVEWNGQLKLDVASPSSPIHGRLISSTPRVNLEYFPEILEIMGKLSTIAVWDYLDKIRRSTNKEIVVVLLEPTKSQESLINYRAALCQLKEKSRHAVVRAQNATVAGSFKDIYLTFTSTEWLRRLISFGLKFIEQLPIESKLACVMVRYTTAPVSALPSQSHVVSEQTSVIPLENAEASVHPTEEAKVSSPAQGNSDETPEVLPALTEPLRSIEEPCYTVKAAPPVPTFAALEQKQDSEKMVPVLSTPEEISSVSELIKKILGGTAFNPAASSSQSTSTATSTTTTSAVIVPVGKSSNDLTTSSSIPAAPLNMPLLPPFPPPLGMLPPVQLSQMPTVPSHVSALPPHIPPFPGLAPGFPLPLASENALPLAPSFPPPPFPNSNTAITPAAQSGPIIIPKFPPPPMPSATAAAPSNSSQKYLLPNLMVTNQPTPEQQISSYLDQLLDETLSLRVRSNLLKELADLLKSPQNEEIVKKNLRLSERFQKAVATVNALVERDEQADRHEKSVYQAPLLPAPLGQPYREGLNLGSFRLQGSVFPTSVKSSPWRLLLRSYHARTNKNRSHSASSMFDGASNVSTMSVSNIGNRSKDQETKFKSSLVPFSQSDQHGNGNLRFDIEEHRHNSPHIAFERNSETVQFHGFQTQFPDDSRKRRSLNGDLVEPAKRLSRWEQEKRNISSPSTSDHSIPPPLGLLPTPFKPSTSRYKHEDNYHPRGSSSNTTFSGPGVAHMTRTIHNEPRGRVRAPEPLSDDRGIFRTPLHPSPSSYQGYRPPLQPMSSTRPPFRPRF